MRQRPATSSIPDGPGSYQFRDARGQIVYVGKAKSLRKRLASYFQDAGSLPPKTAQMVREAASVEWIQVANDAEALMLEYSLIKEHKPRFNVQLRDDKSYPYLMISLGDEWPRPMVVRGARKKGARYFGPYANAGAIRETLDLLVKSLPLRTCSDAKLRRHRQLGKPCLLFHIARCSGPCIGAIDRQEYLGMVDEMCSFLEGDAESVTDALRCGMEDASRSMDYERAAVLRDRLAAASAAVERQQIVTTSKESFDVLGIHVGDLEASVQLFRVRSGRVVGRLGFVLDRIDEPLAGMEEALDPGVEGLVGRALTAAYGESPSQIPREILVPAMPEDPGAYAQWLGTHRGGPVVIKVPKRGARRELQEMAIANARDELVRSTLRRGTDAKTRTDAIESLRQALGMEGAPLRIECYDMSHIQGSDYVGSMVVLQDGLPAKSQYRHFRVKSVIGNDDYAAMREVLERRLARLVERSDDPREDSFSQIPDLILVDGGKGQLKVAIEALASSGYGGSIALAALAKRHEEVFVPGRSEPVELHRGSEGLHLLQRVRDEAHRFAVSYHRSLRGKRMVTSALDSIAGLGPVRLGKLLDEMGGAAGVVGASLRELRELSWLPEKVATEVYERLHA